MIGISQLIISWHKFCAGESSSSHGAVLCGRAGDGPRGKMGINKKWGIVRCVCTVTEGLGQCHITIRWHNIVAPFKWCQHPASLFLQVYGCGGCKIFLAFNILDFVCWLSPSLLIAYILGSFPCHSGFCLLGSASAVLSRVSEVWLSLWGFLNHVALGPHWACSTPLLPVFPQGSSAYLTLIFFAERFLSCICANFQLNLHFDSF